MKRTFTIALFGLCAVALFGCPVFSGGSSSTGGGPACGYGTGCCYSDSDCFPGQLCEGNVCFDEAPEAAAEAGDCSTNGCPRGQECAVVDGGVSCVGEAADGGLPEGAMPDAAQDGATDAKPDAPAFKGCTSNAECGDSGAGALCLDGKCVTPANQCTDGTQCPNSEECVQGGCVPTCSSTMLCPTGYACTTNGVCTGNPAPCGSADGGATCTADTTCVDQHCVPKCKAGDAACASGLVCIDDGCIPDQKPVFTCNADGVQDKCDKGSICLHHSCYIACDPEASTSCTTADNFNICKPVTTSSGTYFVCASSSNLGNDCDPTRDLKCSTSTDVCIDGYCR